MRAKALVLSVDLGVLLLALVTSAFVLENADWRGGNPRVSWFLVAGFLIVFLGFLLCWRQRPRPVAEVACRYLNSLDESLTVQDGARTLRKYAPVLLVASLIYLAGALFALFFY